MALIQMTLLKPYMTSRIGLDTLLRSETDKGDESTAYERIYAMFFRS